MATPLDIQSSLESFEDDPRTLNHIETNSPIATTFTSEQSSAIDNLCTMFHDVIGPDPIGPEPNKSIIDELCIFTGALVDSTHLDTPVRVVNLSSRVITQVEQTLLERGLNFCPTPGEPHLGDLVWTTSTTLYGGSTTFLTTPVLLTPLSS